MSKLKEILITSHTNNDVIYCVDLSIILDIDVYRVHAALRNSGHSKQLQREKVDGMLCYVIPFEIAVAVACKLNFDVALELAQIY